MSNRKVRRRASAALVKQKTDYGSKPDTELQAGPRATTYGELNYNSVTTLDPRRLAAAFRMADQGHITEQAKLFTMVEEQDAHIYSELAKRKRGITSLGWQLEAPDDASQSELDRTKELTDMLRDIDGFEMMQTDALDAIGKGFSPIEIEWRRGDEYVPKAFHFVPQYQFQIDINTSTLQYLNNGVPEALKPNSWIVHEHKSKSGYIEQAALFRVLAWTYAYKAYDIKDMQRFLEKYLMPLTLGKYPAGIAEKQRNELLRAVRAIGNDAAGVVPANMSIDFIQAQGKGQVTDFLSAVEYWEEKQSKAILGGDMTGEGLTEAKILMYERTRREIMLHDVEQLEPTMNFQVVGPVNAFNGMFERGRVPKLTYLTQESPDQAKMMGVLKQGVDLGMEIEVEYAHEVLQIPKAKEGAKILGKPADKTPPPNDKNKPGQQNNPEKTDPAQNALTRLASLAKTQSANANLSDAYAAQLAALGSKHEQQLTQMLFAVINEAGDFDAAIEGIEALAQKFKVPALTEVIALGMAAANLGGRSEVIDGN